MKTFLSTLALTHLGFATNVNTFLKQQEAKVMS
jgi:hypothetical protein